MCVPRKGARQDSWIDPSAGGSTSRSQQPAKPTWRVETGQAPLMDRGGRRVDIWVRVLAVNLVPKCSAEAARHGHRIDAPHSGPLDRSPALLLAEPRTRCQLGRSCWPAKGQGLIGPDPMTSYTPSKPCRGLEEVGKTLQGIEAPSRIDQSDSATDATGTTTAELFVSCPCNVCLRLHCYTCPGGRASARVVWCRVSRSIEGQSRIQREPLLIAQKGMPGRPKRPGRKGKCLLLWRSGSLLYSCSSGGGTESSQSLREQLA